MPYEVESPQQRKITEAGALHHWGERSHTGDIVYVSHAYRNESGVLVWSYLRNLLGRHILSHVHDNHVERL